MKVAARLISVLILSILVISCGSSGGGDGVGGVVATTSGPGEVSAQSLSEFMDFILNNVNGCTSTTANAMSQVINVSSMLNMAGNQYEQVQAIPETVRLFAQAVDIIPPLTGDCGGTLSITQPDSTTELPITIAATTFCAVIDTQQVTINGVLTIDGVLDASGNPVSLSAVSSGISIATAAESLTVVVNASSTFTTNASNALSGLDATITNLSITDNTANEQFSLQNTAIQASGLDTTVVQVQSNGTYRDPVLGTFTFNTQGPMTINTVTEDVSGQVNVDGTGSGKIRVTVNTDDDVIFEADVNDDGAFDVTESMNCTNIQVPTLPAI